MSATAAPIPEPGHHTRGDFAVMTAANQPPATGSSQPAGDDEIPPFRYTGTIANAIEAHWQQSWSDHGTFNAANPSGPLSENFEAVRDRPHTFVMDMFPYP